MSELPASDRQTVKWETMQDRENLSGVRRMDVFPVAKTDTAALSIENTLPMETIQALQKYVNNLFMKIKHISKSSLQIVEVPVRIFPAADVRLVVEDYSRIQVTTHVSYFPWDYEYMVDSLKPDKSLIESVHLEWRFCNEAEARSIFGGGAPGGWFGFGRNKPGGITICGYPIPEKYYCIMEGAVGLFNGSILTNFQVADVYVADIPENCPVLAFILQQKWTPVTEQDSKQWKQLAELFSQGRISITEDGDNIVIQANHGKGMKQAAPDDAQARFELAKRMVLECDYHRANITPYDPMQLEDPNRGSWELWDMLEEDDMDVVVPIPTPVYARDPRLDVKTGGVVGIDFGTKSTVVACQGDSAQIHLVRVGQGAYDQATKESDYENPTVMEFRNLENFLTAYHSREGRPATRWEDLTISHTAFEQWRKNKNSSLYFSFFGELKQWAGSENRHIRVRDQDGTTELSLPPYLTIADGEFDPVELYAYYIGLYINNMHTGQIYLQYLLSFPVTYTKAVREKILDSFRRGLAKSLPVTVLNDPEYAEQFSVEQGAGEPAAYAVCALREYGFRPPMGKNIYYAVFDLGGGTADFDFGMWRKASGPKERRYQYIISHFGDGGDQYLGGENLLELLAFHVFRENQDLLRQTGVTFSLPPQCERFRGSEYLIADSQEAHTNMRQMMEALRPLWERTEGYETQYASGVLKVDLVKRDGQWASSVQIHVNADKLEELLKQRISEGVERFFQALRTVFEHELFESKDADRIYIFLAGNAGKSELLRSAFDKKIAGFTEEIKLVYQKRGEFDQENAEYFLLYPPLGTKEAMEKIGEQDDGSEHPTGKTGVAFGLIQCRGGSKIKVEDATSRDEEIKFLYWLGDDEDGFFFPFMTRENTKYGEWVEYLDAGEEHFEFYYTQDPSAEWPNTLPVRNAKKKNLRIAKSAVSEELSIYLRAVGPNQLEYVVARNLEYAEQEKFEYGPIPVQLD